MFSSLRTSLCLVRRTQRVLLPRSPALRASLSTSATTRRRHAWIPVAAGALTVSVALALGTVVRLDAAEDEKRKLSLNAKQNQSSQVEEFVPDGHKATEILQVQEEETSAEADLDSGEGGGESADHGGGGAFNPETGEINWDCPCLGGMAHGPCGQEFRDAFSCFVYSEEEPKGINCVDKFKNMQDCFRRHPEVYGEEIMSDDDDDDASPSGTDSPGLEGEAVPDPEPHATPTPGIVSPTSES